MVPCFLHVEDEPADITLLRFLFQRAGITNPFHAFTDGQMAFDYLSGAGEFADRTKHPLPCIILLDLKLPKVSGLEVLAWLRQQPSLKHIVVIIFSSSAHPNDIRRAYDLGANSFVQKPAALESTLEIVQALKAWWLGCNCFPLVCQENPPPVPHQPPPAP